MEQENNLKILLLEDSIDDAGLLHYELKKLSVPYELKIADSKEKYEYLLKDFKPDIVLSDYNIPGYNVFEALELARAMDELIPFIIISGVIGETKVIEAMLNGVNDCIMKDKLIRLIPAIEREVSDLENKRIQLVEHEELLLYKEVYQNSNNSIAIIDQDGYFVDVNKAFIELHKYTREEINDISVYKVLGEENMKNIERNLKEEKGFECELKLFCKEGRIIYVDLSSFKLNIKGDDESFIVIIEKNITDKKIAITEKLESERKLELLISNLPGIVYRCKYDEYWTMTYISDSVFHVTGYAKEELINNKVVSFSDLIHPKDKEHVEEVIKNACNKQCGFSIYYKLIKKNGEIIWVWEKGNVLFNERNSLYYIEGYIEDITLERETMLSTENNDTIDVESKKLT